MWTRDHFNELSQRLAEITTQLDQLLKGQKHIIMLLDILTAAVNKETTVEASAVTLIKGLAAQIQTLITNSGNTVDPAALQTLVNSMNASSDALAAAVTANTPTGPAPAATA